MSAAFAHVLRWLRWLRDAGWAPVAVRCAASTTAVLALAWFGALPEASARVPLLPPPPLSQAALDQDALGDGHALVPYPTAHAAGSAPAQRLAAEARAQPAAPAPSDSGLGLNSATAAELIALPGIGPKKAEAILALRQKLGRFKRVEDLLRVKGIGRASLAKLKPLVRIDAAAPPAP